MVQIGLGTQAVLTILGYAASVGQKAELRDEIVARGDLSKTGLTRSELADVIDLTHAISLGVFLGLGVLSLGLLWAVRHNRPWAPFWISPLCALVLAYGVIGIVGDVAAPRARIPLFLAAGLAVAILVVEARAARRRKSGRSDPGASVAFPA